MSIFLTGCVGRSTQYAIATSIKSVGADILIIANKAAKFNAWTMGFVEELPNASNTSLRGLPT